MNWLPIFIYGGFGALLIARLGIQYDRPVPWIDDPRLGGLVRIVIGGLGAILLGSVVGNSNPMPGIDSIAAGGFVVGLLGGLLSLGKTKA